MLREWACSETELVRHCQPELILGLEEPGPSGEQCKVLAKVPGNDQPCCYKAQGGVFALNEWVCFEETNVARRTDEDACRVGSRYPDVKMVDKNCTITLKNPDEQDVGCYEFYMPDNTEKFLFRKCVEYNDICPFSVKYSCKVNMWLIQIACACALVLVVTVAVLLTCRFREKLYPR